MANSQDSGSNSAQQNQRSTAQSEDGVPGNTDPARRAEGDGDDHVDDIDEIDEDDEDNVDDEDEDEEDEDDNNEGSF